MGTHFITCVDTEVTTRDHGRFFPYGFLRLTIDDGNPLARNDGETLGVDLDPVVYDVAREGVNDASIG